MNCQTSQICWMKRLKEGSVVTQKQTTGIRSLSLHFQ